MPGESDKKNLPTTILVAMDEETKAKIATLEAQIASLQTAKKASDDENENLKAKVAALEAKKAGVQDEPATKVQEAQTARIQKLEQMNKEPLIAKMLKAKELSEYSEDEITAEKKRLTAMTLDEVQNEYTANEKLIASVITRHEQEALLAASEESQIPFNGGVESLTAKVISIDEVLSGVGKQ